MNTSGDTLLNCYNPDHVGNSALYHTGKKCSVRGCEKPGGTLWGRDLCFDHNVTRLKAIDGKFSKYDEAELKRRAAR